MQNKIIRLLINPRKNIPVLLKVLQQSLSLLFKNTAFFMQGQMDINPKSRWYSQDFEKLTGGYYPKDDSEDREICDLEPWDNTRRDMLILLLREVVDKNIEGDIVELGVYKGYTAKLLHYYIPERSLHLFDTFEGFSDKGVIAEKEDTGLKVSTSEFSDTSLENVQHYISQQNENIYYYKGYFPDSIPEDFQNKTFSFVHLDADLYEPILEGLKFFYSRMAKNGMIVVHDYNAWPGARKAVELFFSDKSEFVIPMPDKSGSALIVKC